MFLGCNTPENPIPKQIQDLKMGSNIDSLEKLIDTDGTFTINSKSRRPRLQWNLKNNSHYQDIEFQFTEKNRLYLIRFNLKDARRDEFQALKKSFFSIFDLSWDDPLRMRVEGSDMLLYAPNAQEGDIFFLEFTDKLNGKKAIELFSKKISAQDKAAYLEEQKAKKSEDPSVPATGDDQISNTENENQTKPENKDTQPNSGNESR
jgi:hypothetical protein